MDGQTFLLYELSGKPVLFDPTADGVRQFHVPDSVVRLPDFAVTNHCLEWGDPTILRLSDGRWCLRNCVAGLAKWVWGNDDPHDVFREVEPSKVLEIRNAYAHNNLAGGLMERLDRPPFALDHIPKVFFYPNGLLELILKDQADFETRHAQTEPRVSQATATSRNEPPAMVEDSRQGGSIGPMAGDETAKKKASDRREGLVVLIETYGNTGIFGEDVKALAERTKIPLSTLYKDLSHESVKPVWDRYTRDSMGKPPPHIGDL